MLVQPSHVRHMNTDIAMLEDFKFGDRVKVRGCVRPRDGWVLHNSKFC